MVPNSIEDFGKRTPYTSSLDLSFAETWSILRTFFSAELTVHAAVSGELLTAVETCLNRPGRANGFALPRDMVGDMMASVEVLSAAAGTARAKQLLESGSAPCPF